MNQSLTEIAEEIGVNDAFRKVVDLVSCLKQFNMLLIFDGC